MDNQKQRIMEILGVDEETAKQVLADDKAIDRGERLPFDLSKEEEKAVLKSVRGAKAPTAYKFSKRERKADTEKSEIITNLAEFVRNFAENVQILNAERQFSFNLGGNDYEITLVRKRKPKN